MRNATVVELQQFIKSEIEFSVEERKDIARKLVLLQLINSGYIVTDQRNESIIESSRICILEQYIENNVIIGYGTVTKVHDTQLLYSFELVRTVDNIFDEKLKNTQLLQSCEVSLFEDPTDEDIIPLQSLAPISRGVTIGMNNISAPNWNSSRNTNSLPMKNNATPENSSQMVDDAIPQSNSIGVPSLRNSSSSVTSTCQVCKELSKKMEMLTRFSDILSKMINLAGEIQVATKENPDVWRFLPFSATCKESRYSITSELIEKAHRKYGWEIKSHTRYLTGKLWKKSLRELNSGERQFMSKYTVERLGGKKDTIKKYCHEDQSSHEPSSKKKKPNSTSKNVQQ